MWCRPAIPKGRHSDGPPFSAISISDNLRLGIGLGLGLGSVIWLWQYRELFPATTMNDGLQNGGPYYINPGFTYLLTYLLTYLWSIDMLLVCFLQEERRLYFRAKLWYEFSDQREGGLSNWPSSSYSLNSCVFLLSKHIFHSKYSSSIIGVKA